MRGKVSPAIGVPSTTEVDIVQRTITWYISRSPRITAPIPQQYQRRRADADLTWFGRSAFDPRFVRIELPTWIEAEVVLDADASSRPAPRARSRRGSQPTIPDVSYIVTHR